MVEISAAEALSLRLRAQHLDRQQKLLSTLWKKWGQKLLLLILQSNLPISAAPTCSVIIMFTQLSNTDIKDNSRV